MNALIPTSAELAIEYRPCHETFPIPQESPNKRLCLVWEVVHTKGGPRHILRSATIVDVTLVH